MLFLYGNFEYKKDVYEKSMEINEKPLPENYIERLKYEQEEMTAMFKYILATETELFKPEEEGLYSKSLKVLITEENLHLHWDMIERSIFPKSSLTWMEYIFGPVYDLFEHVELNDFLLEWHGADREAIMHLFLGHSEDWCYYWMNYYRDVVENPTHYDGVCEFPRLPAKIPKCMGHISGCENLSHHFCEDCIHHFNHDPVYAYTEPNDKEGNSCVQMPATPETSQSI